MELSYKQLEHTLQFYLEVQPDKVPTLRSRIKQLQRLGFPEEVNVGRGAKMVYSAKHLFQLATAFELLQMNLPAQYVVEYVSNRWGAFAMAFALAQCWRTRMGHGKVFVLMLPQGLSNIQFETIRKRWVLRVVDAPALQAWFARGETNPGNTLPVMSVTSVFSRLAEGAKKVGGIRFATHDPEIPAWLPKEPAGYLDFQGEYPDGSAPKIREYFYRIYGVEANVPFELEEPVPF